MPKIGNYTQYTFIYLALNINFIVLQHSLYNIKFSCWIMCNESNGVKIHRWHYYQCTLNTNKYTEIHHDAVAGCIIYVSKLLAVDYALMQPIHVQRINKFAYVWIWFTAYRLSVQGYISKLENLIFEASRSICRFLNFPSLVRDKEV